MVVIDDNIVSMWTSLAIFIYISDENETMRRYARIYTLANDASNFSVELDNSFWKLVEYVLKCFVAIYGVNTWTLLFNLHYL